MRSRQNHPLHDAAGMFCRACATRIKTGPAGTVSSHAPGGARVSLKNGMPHCYGSRRTGWDHDFPTVSPDQRQRLGWLTVADIADRFGLSPLAIRLMHLRDLFPLPVAIQEAEAGNMYVYDNDRVARFLAGHTPDPAVLSLRQATSAGA